MTAKEKCCIIVRAQQAPVLFFHHGSQLLQVAYHQELNTAERFRAITIPTQYSINCIQLIGTYHTDFIDHQQVHTTDNIDFFFSEFMKTLLSRIKCAFRNVRCEVQLKKGVYSDTSGINGSNPRRCNHYHTLWGKFF